MLLLTVFCSLSKYPKVFYQIFTTNTYGIIHTGTTQTIGHCSFYPTSLQLYSSSGTIFSIFVPIIIIFSLFLAIGLPGLSSPFSCPTAPVSVGPLACRIIAGSLLMNDVGHTATSPPVSMLRSVPLLHETLTYITFTTNISFLEPFIMFFIVPQLLVLPLSNCPSFYHLR